MDAEFTAPISRIDFLSKFFKMVENSRREKNFLSERKKIFVTKKAFFCFICESIAKKSNGLMETVNSMVSATCPRCNFGQSQADNLTKFFFIS